MKKKPSLVSIFFAFFNQYPKEFLTLFCLLLLEGIIALFALLSVVPLADYLFDQNLLNPSKVTTFVIYIFQFFKLDLSFLNFGFLFIILNAFKGAFEVGIKFAILKIKYRVVRGLFGDALKNFFNAKWEFFSHTDSGQILTSLNKELNTIGDTLGQLATLLAQFIQLIIYLIVPILLNPKLTLIAFILIFIFSLPFLLLHKKSYGLGVKNIETANLALGTLNEILQGAKIILGFGKQQYSQNQFINSFDKHISSTLKSQILSTAIPKFFLPFALMSVIIAMSFAVRDGALLSELAAVLWSFLTALPICAALLQSSISINNFLPSYEQLINLNSKAISLSEVNGKELFLRLNHKISLNNVSFTYPGRLNTLLKLDLSIKKGEMTALIGESGSGKSTIIDIVLGLQVPDSGLVLIDDLNFSEFDKNSFRSKLGYVPQDSMLFNSSIRDNLLWAKDNASENDLWDSLKLANADFFVKDLPEGIDTIVGERGVRLSGGQRQRIALARALIRKPELLILDEATSALDSESERLIQQSIENIAYDTTILIIAHRLSTIAKADQVYVMRQGLIVEQGSYIYLSKKKDGELYKMLHEQSPSS
jgi:ABC-type multidrug transport system fused ATPase/permease subunit